MKSIDSLVLSQAIDAILALESPRFAERYPLIRTKARFRAPVEELRDALAALEQERLRILAEHSQNDGEGNPIIRDGRYCVPDRGVSPKFDQAIDDLADRRQALFSEDVTAEVYKMTLETVKSLSDRDGVTGAMIEPVVLFMVDEAE